MAGLQAHDFEAYQEMLAEKQGADGGRYEAISKFLTETEEYLNRLAGKVAHVRAGQQAAEAQAKAIAEAIAQVGSACRDVKADCRPSAARACRAASS